MREYEETQDPRNAVFSRVSDGPALVDEELKEEVGLRTLIPIHEIDDDI